MKIEELIKLPEMKEKLNQVKEQLIQLEKTRDRISEEMYSKMKDRYDGEIGELSENINRIQSEGEMEEVDLQMKINTIEENIVKAEKNMEELETLSISGAIDESSYKGKKAEIKKEVQGMNREKYKMEKEREKVHLYLTEEIAIKGGVSKGTEFKGINIFRELIGKLNDVWKYNSRQKIKMAGLVIISILLIIVIIKVIGELAPGFFSKNKSIGGIEFVYIKGGEFMMGSNSDNNNERPRHSVKVDGFWIGKYEVTQKQYQSIMGKNPSSYKGYNLPVNYVSWHDAVEFCKKFSRKYGVMARLPYEAEWEYACRAGTTTKYYWGDNINDSYCWYCNNSGKRTHQVGERRPNGWGLYDMSGNVWEWCIDWYDEKYYRESPSDNPKGPASGKYRVLRGGSWVDVDVNLRSSRRLRYYPLIKYYINGFRVVVSDTE